MLAALRAIFAIFGPTAKRRVLWLIAAMLVVAVVEAASVAVVLPFLDLALNPDQGATGLVARVIDPISARTGMLPVVVVGWIALGLFLLSSGLSALTNWYMYTIAGDENRRLSTRLLEGYVHQPYPFFLDRNTSDLTKNVLFEVDMLTNNALIPLGSLAGRAMLVLAVVGFLVYSDPAVALGIMVTLTTLYGALYLAIRGPVARLAPRRIQSNADRFRTAQEALGGIKEVKVLGREAFFAGAFAKSAQEFTTVIARGQIIGSVPKYFLEAVAIGGILALLLSSLQQEGNGAEVVPLLALYAAAAYRLMPALQQIYTGVTNLKFCRDLILLLRDELANQPPQPPSPANPAERLELAHSFGLDGATFRYPRSETPVLNDVTLTITKNHAIGVVGSTGSGKSTIIDVLLGLLTPQAGAVVVDGRRLSPAEFRRWRQNIGYVPQTIFLADASIRRNIAFGVEDAVIDDAAVVKAARLAGVHDFIVEETPEGYETQVGERGVRLSGGQRQRIGIARALYHDPEIVLLDEATSALDNVTEQAVMAAIRALAGQKTIVVVAHRLTTVQDCDEIVVLQAGEICERGRYEDLVKREGVFAELVRAAQ